MTTEPEKLRGGYYTSAPLAGWLCEWAIRARTDTVLEPSCGDGVFLEAAAKRLIDLGLILRDIWIKMRDRRLARRRAPNGGRAA
jgi:hypothetical protein